MSIYGLIAVGLGAVLGAWLRWGLSIMFNPIFPSLPLGTLASNLIGGYLIGVFFEFFNTHVELPPEARLLVITGFLGALTTFSTFSAESATLLASEQFDWGAIHIASHLTGSVALTFLGIFTVKWLQGL